MVIKYYSGLYVEDIKTLLKSRDMDLSLASDIPQIGVVAIQNDQVIAYGGLRIIEGDRGMLDSYITLIDALPEDRNLALDMITKELLDKAKYMGLKQVIVFSLISNIRMRATKFGFHSFESAYLQIISP